MHLLDITKYILRFLHNGNIMHFFLKGTVRSFWIVCAEIWEMIEWKTACIYLPVLWTWFALFWGVPFMFFMHIDSAIKP